MTVWAVRVPSLFSNLSWTPVSLINRQDTPICPYGLVPQACFWRLIFCHLVRPCSYSVVSSSLGLSLPKTGEGEGENEGGVSSKVTFGVSPSESVSSWQGRDSFNFSPTGRSSCFFFKRLWDRQKERKMFFDFSILSEGLFFPPALSRCQKWAFSDYCQIAAADGLMCRSDRAKLSQILYL